MDVAVSKINSGSSKKTGCFSLLPYCGRTDFVDHGHLQSPAFAFAGSDLCAGMSQEAAQGLTNLQFLWLLNKRFS
jgi:hypothetical protein